MARKEIGTKWDRENRNNMNDNFIELYNTTNNFVEKVSEEAFDKVIDASKLVWKEPVDSHSDLPSSASEGDTIMARDSGKVYRFDGSEWKEIQQLDSGPINEVDERLSSQLAETDDYIFKSSLVNHRKNKKMAVWQDDDGRAGIYTKLAPIAREYGVVITSAIYTNGKHGLPIEGLPSHDPKYISYDKMKELENEGIIEFVSHTHNHTYLDSVTDEEIHYELETSKNIMKKMGWNYKDLVYPGGRNDQNIRNITRQYYESAFKVGNILPDGPFEQYAIPRVSIPNSAYDVEEKKAEIDKLLDRFGFVTFMTHADLDAGIDVEKFKLLIEYVQSKGIEFVTTRELIQEHGHLFQQGDNIITANGEFYGDRLGRYVINDKAPLNGSVDEFTKGAVARTRVFQDDSPSYNIPYQQGKGDKKPFGNIETFRDVSQDAFSFQVFHDVPNFRTLQRRWLTSENSWSEWEYLGESVYFTETTNPNDNVSEFVKGQITKVKVTQNNSEYYGIPKFGNNVPFGYIDVVRDLTNDDYSYQIFYDLKNNFPLIRKWSKASNDWGTWKIFGGNYFDAGRLNTLNLPITEFKKGLVTKIRVLQDDAPSYNLPDGTEGRPFGNIEVHRDNAQDTYSYRVMNDLKNKRILMSVWDTSLDNWGDWSIVNS